MSTRTAAPQQRYSRNQKREGKQDMTKVQDKAQEKTKELPKRPLTYDEIMERRNAIMKKAEEEKHNTFKRYTPKRPGKVQGGWMKRK